jgi:hypothetical protein
MAWPKRFTYHEVTKAKVFPDDVALYALRTTPADPRPDPLEALREAQEHGSALVSAVLGGDKMEMLAAADAFNKGYPQRQKATASAGFVIDVARETLARMEKNDD